MPQLRFRRSVVFVCLTSVLFATLTRCSAEITAKRVLQSIKRGNNFLISQQQRDGSWSAGSVEHKTGVTSLALLALINGGRTLRDPVIQRGLKYLRLVNDPDKTYDVALMIMALASAKDGRRDKARISKLARKLEASQVKTAVNAGTWSYSVSGNGLRGGGDRSNGQYAILGLRDAVNAGVPIRRDTWKRARDHWIRCQGADGGWGYSGLGGGSSGSMTVAGIASLVITQSMLQDDKDVGPDGKIICCKKPEDDPTERAIQRGLRWLGRRFSVQHNPGGSGWPLYYLYGLERAGRLSGHRLIGGKDWYRLGAEHLTGLQLERGFWKGKGSGEDNEIVGTSFSLLFLSKGLAPVLINKLKFGPREPRNRDIVLGGDTAGWNRHGYDIRNLTDNITGLEKWPKLLTWQVVDIDKVVRNGSVEDLLQSPVLYISGSDALEFHSNERAIEILKGFLDQGGFIFAVNCCQEAGFHDDMFKLVKELFPNGESKLKRLPREHAIFRSEYLLNDLESIELWGVDVGCRTAIVYSPDDLACGWEKWGRLDVPDRPIALTTRIVRDMKVGVNVIAYATGREPPKKFERKSIAVEKGQQDKIERGLLKVPKLIHSGVWDAAPQALRKMMLALNTKVGMTASTKQRNLLASDSNIFKYPIVYMHGRNNFELSELERDNLKKYLMQGGVLFADACCGSSRFDKSFRVLMKQLFPTRKLKQIPTDDPLFEIGYDIRQVKRRSPDTNNKNVEVATNVRTVKPYLQGVEFKGRYAVIYSKYDISCALERTASLTCSGYVHDDAVKIAINVLMYSLLQEVR